MFLIRGKMCCWMLEWEVILGQKNWEMFSHPGWYAGEIKGGEGNNINISIFACVSFINIWVHLTLVGLQRLLESTNIRMSRQQCAGLRPSPASWAAQQRTVAREADILVILVNTQPIHAWLEKSSKPCWSSWSVSSLKRQTIGFSRAGQPRRMASETVIHPVYRWILEMKKEKNIFENSLSLSPGRQNLLESCDCKTSGWWRNVIGGRRWEK